jgi:hypothetical protein
VPCSAAHLGPPPRCLDRLGYHTITTYQPPSHYWPFQIIEGSLFAVVGIALVAAAIVWTLHRDA